MSENTIDPKKLERAIRKIKHCLALSQSSNENEAATAMRQAQALMREYHLSETEVKVSGVGEAQSSMSRAARRPLWDQQLSAVVAKVFNVKALRYTHWCETKKNRVERAKFVGVSPAQHIALYAYETLLAKLTQARNAYVSGVRAGKHRSCYSAPTAGDHFAIAWVFAVESKLQELVPRGEEPTAPEHQSAGQGLVAVEAQHQALIESYLADKQIGKARKVREAELDLNAQIAGMLAGTKVDLHAGLAIHPHAALGKPHSSGNHRRAGRAPARNFPQRHPGGRIGMPARTGERRRIAQLSRLVSRSVAGTVGINQRCRLLE